jgi:hypothetical protein
VAGCQAREDGSTTWELSRAQPRLAAAKAKAVTKVERALERMRRTWHPCARWTKKMAVANVKRHPESRLAVEAV